MNPYRKLYNANILGTSDISILKFYYASYKIQESKGNVSSIGEFLDLCAETALDTSIYAKILGFLPLVNSDYSAELKRIAKFIKIRRSDVEALFQQEMITDKDVENLLYGIDKIETKQAKTIEEQLNIAKEYILKCYSIKRRKQLGDRIFGYLLKAEIIQAYTPKERLTAWYKFIGENIKPSNVKLHTNPKFPRASFGKESINLPEQLETIQIFFNEIELYNVEIIVKRDLEKLLTAPK